MKLEDAEKLAQRHIDNLLAIYGRLPPPQGNGDMLAYNLARALLAILPVVRAAEAWRETMDWLASRAPGEVFTCEEQLYDAIGSMRAALAKEQGMS